MMTSNRKSLRFQTIVNYMKKSKYNYRLRLLDYDYSMPEPYHIHKSNRTQTFRQCIYICEQVKVSTI